MFGVGFLFSEQNPVPDGFQLQTFGLIEDVVGIGFSSEKGTQLQTSNIILEILSASAHNILVADDGTVVLVERSPTILEVSYLPRGYLACDVEVSSCVIILSTVTVV